jgi:hypothetical protein
MPESNVPNQAEVEYRQLTDYLKYVVTVTGSAIGLVVAVGAFFFYSNLREARKDAVDSANHASREAVSEAVQKPNVEKIIQDEVSRLAEKNLAKVVESRLDIKTLGHADGQNGGDQCQRQPLLQICWGQVTIGTNNGYGQANFKFAAAFEEVPVITWSMSGGVTAAKDYQEYVPFAASPSKGEVSVTAIEVRGRQGAGPVTVSYFAFGKPSSQ